MANFSSDVCVYPLPGTYSVRGSDFSIPNARLFIALGRTKSEGVVEIVQILNLVSFYFSLKHQKRLLPPDGYIVNSIIAFTISLLLFFRARTAFARDTFA